MQVDLEHSSFSDKITINSVSFDKDEIAVAIGIGISCNEAEKNLKWYNRDNIPQGVFLCDKNYPFIALRKKKSGGKIIISDKCINILDIPKGNNQINRRTINF